MWVYVLRRSRTDWSLSRAKQVVSRHYLTVGIQEELGDFVKLMATLMPHFFSGGTEVFAKLGRYIYGRLSCFSANIIVRCNQEHCHLTMNMFTECLARFF